MVGEHPQIIGPGMVLASSRAHTVSIASQTQTQTRVRCGLDVDVACFIGLFLG
jgi:hypothetical protein